ncbi:MAG: acyltransferase family protein [Clostridium sp.]|uniref:acyltransferase n=1 Tax=Clostridium sp. TaxID=1506 RepID=UPI00302CF0FF
MKREKNLDYLRVIVTIMVITIHVSAKFINENIWSHNFNFVIGNLFESFSRVSVPIFVMLSGGLILTNVKNKNYKEFYIKTFKRIIIPVLMWSFIYFIYNLINGTLKGDENVLINAATRWISGMPFHHLWYVYMIIGMYIITPTTIIILEKLEGGSIVILAIFLLIIGFTASLKLKLIWPFQFIQYIGYYIIGYQCKIYYKNNRCKPNVFMFIYGISSLGIFFITELIMIKGLLTNNKLYFYEYLSPFVMIGSISLYIGFLNIKNKKLNLSKLSNHTFNIYLIHAGVLELINSLMSNGDIANKIQAIPLIYIPSVVLIVFIISLYISHIIESMTKYRRTNKRVINPLKKAA